MSQWRITSDGAAAVSDDQPWLPLSEATPLYVKVQLINRASGVACINMLTERTRTLWTHWAPLPTFEKHV